MLYCTQLLKDTHRENAPSNTTETPTKSVNLYIWAIGTLNQLFIRGSYTQIKFKKNEVISGKSALSVISSFFTPHSICLLTLAFNKAVLYRNVELSFVVL